jgi:hypothetical protein
MYRSIADMDLSLFLRPRRGVGRFERLSEKGRVVYSHTSILAKSSVVGSLISGTKKLSCKRFPSPFPRTMTVLHQTYNWSLQIFSVTPC